MKMFRIILIGAVIGLISMNAAAAVRKVDAPFVYAKDLINRCKDFCDVQIAKSPAPGQKSTIYAREVIRSLDAAGFSFGSKRLPKSFRVLRTSRSMSADGMTDAARKAITDVLPEGVVLEQMGNVSAGKVPEGRWEARAVYDESIGAARTRSIAVVFLHDGVPFRKVFVLCRMAYMVNVPVAAMDIQRNEIVQPGAVTIKQMKLDPSQRYTLLNVDDIVGKKSRGVIRSGSVFETRDLIELPLVHKGDNITVVSNINGIRITARGVARQNAVRGKRIAVEIPTVGKILFAEVVSAGLGVVTR